MVIELYKCNAVLTIVLSWLCLVKHPFAHNIQAPKQQHQAPATPSQGNSTSSMYQSIDLDAEEISWVMTPAPGKSGEASVFCES
eukprot:1160448-Pelagomonas_calceolata.AAC.3